MPKPLKVLIVDPHPDAGAGIRRALNGFGRFEVVGEADFGPVASTWARILEPALVIVAVDEPLTRSLTTIQALVRGNPPWTVVGLVNQFDAEVIRRAVLAGARDVVLRGSSPRDLHDCLVRAHNADPLRILAAGHDPVVSTGSIISVFSAKRGVGKTTLATNLAVVLAAEASVSVAVVDLDVTFGDVARMLDVRYDHSIMDPIADAMDDLERLQKLLLRSPHGVHVLPAPLPPVDTRGLDGRNVAKLLGRLAALHRFVLVDTPAGLNELTAAALDASEVALLVTTPEIASLRRANACLQVLERLKFSTSKLQVVLNRVGPERRLSAAAALDALAHPVAWRVANDYAAMQGSAFGRPAIQSRPESWVAKDIKIIARQLAQPRSTLRSDDASEGPEGAACGAKLPRHPMIPSAYAEAVPPEPRTSADPSEENVA